MIKIMIGKRKKRLLIKTLHYLWRCYMNITKPCLLFETHCFGDWILSPSSGGSYSVCPNIWSLWTPATKRMVFINPTQHNPTTRVNIFHIEFYFHCGNRTYGIQLWGCAKPSNAKIIQKLQSNVLRTITNASWYASNFTLHTDLQIPFIQKK
jgi:hypothetical protein